MPRMPILLLFVMSTIAHAQDFPVRPDKITSRFQVELIDAAEAGTLGAAPTSAQARSISPLGLALIIHFEGAVLNANGVHIPYNDASSFCTIGYGHLIKKQECALLDLEDFRQGIDENRARQLLERDLAYARLAVQRNTQCLARDPSCDAVEREEGSIYLSIDEFSSLVSFVYNVGEGNFASSTLLRRLKQDRKVEASKEFLQWIKSNGQILAGLRARRECEQTLFLEELVLDKNGEFARSNCSSLAFASVVGDLINIEDGEDVPQ